MNVTAGPGASMRVIIEFVVHVARGKNLAATAGKHNAQVHL